MATIVNFSGSVRVTLQVLSIIRRSTITIYTPRRPQSLEPGQKIVFENLRTQEWKPVVIQGKIQGIPRSCVVSIPSDRELRHNQSQIRLSPIGPDHRHRWVRFHLGSRQTGNGAESKPECQSRHRQPACQPIISGQGSRGHYVTLCGQIVKASLVRPLRLYFGFCRTLSHFLSSICL